jgi:hypothetical protein
MLTRPTRRGHTSPAHRNRPDMTLLEEDTMVLNHLPGLMLHPESEWQVIRKGPCTVRDCYLSHVIILAAIPALAGFIGATQVGWQVGAGDVVKLTVASALQIAIAFYLAMLAGVYFMGKTIHWMGKTYGSNPTPAQGVALAAYTSTPLFLVGIVALIPAIWLLLLVGLLGLAYTIYLLYTGTPIIMGVSREQGFLFASAVLMVGLVTLVGMLTVTVLLWGIGIAPAFTH